jgi:hypothetical protein
MYSLTVKIAAPGTTVRARRSYLARKIYTGS